jgi:hypothetical protein
MRIKPEDLKPVPEEFAKFFEKTNIDFGYLESLAKEDDDYIAASKLLTKEGTSLMSLFVYEYQIREDLWENPAYVTKKEVELCSRLEEEIRRMWVDSNSEMNRKLDAIIAAKQAAGDTRGRNALIDECAAEVEKSLVPQAEKNIQQEYRELYGRSWKKEFSKINEPRKETRYERIRSHVPKIWHNLGRHSWIQTYVAEIDGRPYIANGGFESSGTRATNSFFGYTFAKIQHDGKNIPTHVFVHTDDNQILLAHSFDTFAMWKNGLGWNFDGRGKEFDEIRRSVHDIVLPSYLDKRDYIEIKK